MKKFKTLFCLSLCLLIFVTQVSAAGIVSPDIKYVNTHIYKVTASSLYMRSGPSTSYSKIGSLLKDHQILIDGQNRAGTWYHMPKRDYQIEAWVSADYVSYVKTN